MQGSYRAIRVHEPGECYSSWEVWYGEESRSGWSGGLFEVCETQAEAERLARRLNVAGVPPAPADYLPF